jgi:hypothetical protein
MLILECSQGYYGRTDGSVTISLHNFVGEGIIITRVIFEADFIGCFLLVPDWEDEQWTFDELVVR